MGFVLAAFGSSEQTSSRAHTFLQSQIVCLDPAIHCFPAAFSTSLQFKSTRMISGQLLNTRGDMVNEAHC